MLQHFHNFLRGSVRCMVSGARPVLFLNRCAAEEIAFWDLRYRDANCLALSMSARDYRRIRPVARASGCSVRLTGKRGALYEGRRLLRRAVLLMGVLCLCGAMWLMNAVILSFDVTGCETVAPAAVLDALRAEGVGIGTLTRRVDASELRDRILLAMPELSWFTVTIRGSHAVVDVRERGKTPEIPDRSRPADIIADRDGVIEILRASHGEELVKPGEAVQAGQVLVSGLVHLRLEEKTMLTHAEADIFARVWHQSTAALPLFGETKVPTGRKSVRYALSIGKFRINFYGKGGNPFAKCDKIIDRYEVALSDGSILPVTWIRETSIEYESFPQMLEESAVSGTLLDTAHRRVRADGRGSVVSRLGERVWTENGVLYVRATGESVQKIGVTVLRE